MVFLVPGEAHEYEPPSRLLSPHELLVMKNKDGHTPVVKAFAGGVHIGVIRCDCCFPMPGEGRDIIVYLEFDASYSNSRHPVTPGLNYSLQTLVTSVPNAPENSILDVFFFLL